MENSMKKKNVYICVAGSLCCTSEIEGTLYFNYTLIKTAKKGKKETLLGNLP